MKAKQDETYFIGHAVHWTKNSGQYIDGIVYIGVDFYSSMAWRFFTSKCPW